MFPVMVSLLDSIMFTFLRTESLMNIYTMSRGTSESVDLWNSPQKTLTARFFLLFSHAPSFTDTPAFSLRSHSPPSLSYRSMNTHRYLCQRRPHTHIPKPPSCSCTWAATCHRRGNWHTAGLCQYHLAHLLHNVEKKEVGTKKAERKQPERQKGDGAVND